MNKPALSSRVYVQLIWFAALLLVPTACGNNGVDKAKVDSVKFDAHFLFFDQDLQTVDLNTAEADSYFALKAGDEKQAEALKKPKGDQPAVPGPATDPPSSADAPTPTPLPPVPTRASSYVDDCREAGVPIPPPFGKPGWEELEPLKKEQIFSDPEYNPLYIWRYKSTEPEGICAATVRYKKGQKKGTDPSKNVEVVGIICQGKKTGKACFWATKHSGNKFGANVSEMMNGDDIPTTTDPKKKPLKCSYCHLGSNAFIVHPGTSLDAFSVDPDQRYQPVSKRFDPDSNQGDKWSNPVNKATFKDGQCGGCHEFAKVNKVWCEHVLKKALGKTMPPEAASNPAGNWRTAYADDIAELKRQCKAAGYDLDR